MAGVIPDLTHRRYDDAVPPRDSDPLISRAFGKALKMARTQLDLKQRDVAERSGLSEVLIGRFERGEREPTVSALMAIARALGTSEEALLAATRQQIAMVRPSSVKAAREAPIAMAIIVQGGQVLMTRRVRERSVLGGGVLRWSPPAGKLEPDETPEQTVIREMREELGVEVRVLRLLASRIHPKSPERRLHHYFACEIVSGVAHAADIDEIAEVRWCTLAEADEMVMPYGGFEPEIREYLLAAMAGERT